MVSLLIINMEAMEDMVTQIVGKIGKIKKIGKMKMTLWVHCKYFFKLGLLNQWQSL